jgi:hypothetical protein
VLAFALVVAAALLAIAVREGVEGTLLAGGAVLVLATAGLVLGLRVAWLFLTIVAVGDLVYIVASSPAWAAMVVNGTLLALLLAGSTRRHARAPGWP